MARKGVPTLSDVAERAGVGRAAVSAALNGTSGGTRVSEATRERILRAAQELRYAPNAVARSLRRRRTDILSFYTGDRYADVANPFVAQLVSGIQLGCRENNKDLLFHGEQVVADPRMDGRPPRLNARRSVEEVYAALTSGKVDGLILYVEAGDPILPLLAESHLPVVVVADGVPFLPSVVVDDVEGGRLQARHLAQKGHRRILYHTRGQERRSVARRTDAFLEAADALGMAVRVCRTPEGASVLSEADEESLFTGPPDARPTAVACWADLAAYRLLNRMARKGRRIPEEAAVMGYDGFTFPVPPLQQVTSVRAPWREVARTAVSLLVQCIEGKGVPQETVLPVELLPGDTT
jgi:LacI family transcriptional regulator/LacI family purine nucleotide synthesis repressor